MTTVEAINVKFGGDTRDLDRAVRRSESRLERFQRSARNMGAALKRVGLVAGVAAGAVSALTRSVVRSTDQIGKSAQTASVTTDQIQELRFAFGQLAGTTSRDLDLALQRFNRRLGLAATGSAEYAKALDDLGVSATSETAPALETVLRRLALIDSDSRRAATASRLFGEEAGPKLASALSNGTEEVERLRAALREEGGVISAENIERSEEFNDAMDRMTKILTAKTADAVLENADALEKLAIAAGNVASSGIGALSGVTGFLSGLTPPTTTGTAEAAASDPLTGGRNTSGDVPRVTTFSDGRTRFSRAPPPLPGPVSVPDVQRRPGGSGLGSLIGPADGLSAIGSIGTSAREGVSGMDALLDKLAEAQRVIADTRTPTESYVAEVQRLVRILDEGFISQDTFNRAVEQAGERLEQLQADQTFDELRNGLANALIDGIDRGADGMLASFTQVLQRMATEALQSQLLSILENLGGGGGGFLGKIGGAIAGSFGGARATGGPVDAGKTFLVGEQGPELLRMGGRSGTIIPNAEGGGGGSLTFAPVVNISGGATEQDRALMRAELRASEARISDLLRRRRF